MRPKYSAYLNRSKKLAAQKHLEFPFSPELFEQFNLDLLNLEQTIVLPAEENERGKHYQGAIPASLLRKSGSDFCRMFQTISRSTAM